MSVTIEQRKLMREALGLNNEHNKAFRNIAYVDIGNPDYEQWLELQDKDYARRETLTPSIYLFFVTPAGLKEVRGPNEYISEIIWK